MLSIESISERFFKDPAYVSKLLIGSLLCFIPIIHIVSLGYLYRMALNIEINKPLSLPEWDNWYDLIKNGLLFLALALVFIGIPLGIGFLLSMLLFYITFGILGIITYLPLAIMGLITPSIFVSALFRFQKYRSIYPLSDIKSLIIPLIYVWPKVLLGTFCTLGFMFILSPLYGFSIFIGLAFLIYYFAIILKISEDTI